MVASTCRQPNLRSGSLGASNSFADFPLTIKMSNSFPMGSALPKVASKIAYGHVGHLLKIGKMCKIGDGASSNVRGWAVAAGSVLLSLHVVNPHWRCPSQFAVALLNPDVVIVDANLRLRIGPGS